MYQSLNAKSSQRLAEKGTNGKPHIKTERILRLEQQLRETKDLTIQYKAKIENLKSIISSSKSSDQNSSQDEFVKKDDIDDQNPGDNNENSLNLQKSQVLTLSERKFIRVRRGLESKQKDNELNEEYPEDNCELRLKNHEPEEEEFKQNSEANGEHQSLDNEQKKEASNQNSEVNKSKVQ